MTQVYQVLPIRYGNVGYMERELGAILGVNGFRIDGFRANQWIVWVSRKLNDTEIATVRANIRLHYRT
ncbi:hypothetical protein F5Y04DRAFT_244567 [Hypomontagnella monticulosa]|nr:hypothetical protein F5Y04DRAFT_244567 [Hypomontagnella monticulosa]